MMYIEHLLYILSEEVLLSGSKEGDFYKFEPPFFDPDKKFTT